MADESDAKAEVSAEKAYAAAAQAAPAKAVAGEPALTDGPAGKDASDGPATPIAFPAKAEREAKGSPAPTKPAPPRARKAAAKAKAPPRQAKPKIPAKANKIPAKAKTPAPVKTSPAPQLKERPMDKTADFVADAQAKAKTAFEQGTALFGEYTDFAKSNVEAFVESGKILAAGIQEMGSGLLAEGKAAVEATTADVKQLAAAKSPSEFFKLQSDILRRNFESAFALTSKNGEAAMKLAGESFAPISGRVSLAVEKLKQAA